MIQIDLFEQPQPQRSAYGSLSFQRLEALAKQPDTLEMVLAVIPASEFVPWRHIRQSLTIVLGAALTTSLRLLEQQGLIETQKHFFGSEAPWLGNYQGYETLYRRKET